MSLWRQFVHGTRVLFNRRDADRDVADEIQHYLNETERAHIARGLSPDAAHRVARLELGNVSAVREQVRSSGWEQALGTVLTDVRYALRMLRKSPVFAGVVVLVVALGSGAVTTIYSGINAMLLRPLPGTNMGRQLVAIDRKHSNGKEGVSASYAFFQLLQSRAHSFSGIGAWTNAALTISQGSGGIAAFGNIVSGNYFKVLGVEPLLGRFFVPEEDRTPLTHPVIVLSERFWRTQLAADSNLVGRELLVNGSRYTVIGVAPAGFRGVFTPLKVDAWVPLMMQPQLRPNRALTDPSQVWLHTFGRLQPGVTDVAARQELSQLTAVRAADGSEPEFLRKYTVVRTYPMTGLPDDASGTLLAFVSLLFAASALVLLIASVNVASLLSARAVSRRREMAVRAALGAARSRLVRQLLTESLVLFALGALGGVAIAVVATRGLEQLPVPDGLVLELSPDYRVLAFALFVSLVTGIVFGLAPALQAVRQDIVARLRADTAGSGVRRTKLASALIVGQLALSLVLMVSAGLFLRALDKGQQVHPGFEAANVSVSLLSTEGWGYDGVRGRAFYHALRERLQQTPGVAAVSFTQNVPLAFETSGARIDTAAGSSAMMASAESRNQMAVQTSNVDVDYFAVLRIPLISGRAFGSSDTEDANKVVIIDERLARQLSPGGDAVGRTLGIREDRLTIVGVARAVMNEGLSASTTPFLYLPLAQNWSARQNLLVRAVPGTSAAAIAASIRRAMREIDPLLPPPVVTTMQERNAIVLLPQRVAAMVTGALGLVGLLLATVGLYGSMAYAANRRTREIGIRVALGAQRRTILGMMVGEGMRLAAFGVSIGLVLAVLATRLMSAYLFEVSPLDVLTFAGMSGVFAIVAGVASFVPARRAAGVDPVEALRME